MPPRPDRPLASVVALLLALAALSGCGASGSTASSEIAVTVTRDFGSTSVVDLPRERVPAPPGLARLLERHGGVRASDSLFVNGIRADEPAAELGVHGGDRVWLDRHETRLVKATPAVVGSFPEPFVRGIGGKRLPVRVECDDPRGSPCSAVSEKLVSLGVVAGRSVISRSAADDSVRILVGEWKRVRGREFEADSIDEGPRSSGVFARFDETGDRLIVFDAAGRPARALGAGTGLIAATAAPERRPVWFVTGTDAAGVAAAARALDESVLADRFALAISLDLPVAVPQP
ncbi:MAG: hypothetical protein Q8O56_10330 [Solirubrobacteraceae bacterium]|nr:hypothetical protein [Solirubrobacteraceae bacterium]